MGSGYLTGRIMLLGCAICCSAQQPSAPEPEAPMPRLRVTTRLVVLDVVVTDKHGKPVRNLSKEDFTIIEDGGEQSIASFEPPDQHAPAPVEENRDSKTTKEAAAPAVSSSALTILVLDELDTAILDQAYARWEIRKFLRTQGPRLREPTALMAWKRSAWSFCMTTRVMQTRWRTLCNATRRNCHSAS